MAAKSPILRICRITRPHTTPLLDVHQGSHDVPSCYSNERESLAVVAENLELGGEVDLSYGHDVRHGDSDWREVED